MDTWSAKYADIIAREAHIRMELSIAIEKLQKMPTNEVLVWLENVVEVRNQLLEEGKTLKTRINTTRVSLEQKNTTRQYLNRLMNETDRLLKTSHFPNGLVVKDELVVLKSPILVGTSAQRTEHKIWNNLMDPMVRNICIYGTAGVGKTTMMRNVTNRIATTVMFDKIFWVTVPHDMSLDKLRTDIALQLNLDLSMHQGPSAKLYERLKNMDSFLIVFDDVCKQISFEVEIPDLNYKMIYITRSLEICRDLISDRNIRVGCLSAGESWDLFLTKVGDTVLTPDIQHFAEEVVRECLGLPIVILSVGHAMRDVISVEEWRKALENLKATRYMENETILDVRSNAWNASNRRQSQDERDGLVKLLQFSYTRLKNDILQNCFLYCAFFPEDYHFKPDELIRYWMAENFIAKDGDIVAEIDRGLDILNELHVANMVEKFTRGGYEWFKLHALFRDMAINIMKEDPRFVIEAGVNLQKLSFYWEWDKAARVSLMSNRFEMLDYLPKNSPNVLTLLLQDNPIRQFFPSFFSRMTALKFLDISHSWIIELPSSLSELAQLRALFLQYCTRLKKIPSLEKMKELEVLSLCGTTITELPHGMEGLVSLRSLDLSETTKSENIRVGMISSLSGLEELRMQGNGFCNLDSTIVTKFFLEMRCLKRLAILTLSAVSSIDHLETIMCLQSQNLKIFSINMFGSTEDCIDDADTM